MNKDTRKLTAFRLSDAEHQRLRDLAALDNVSKSEAVRRIIDRSHKQRVKK